MMDLEIRKKQLLEWINGLNDEDSINRLELLRDSGYDEVDEGVIEIQRKIIENGLDDLKNGRTVPHEAVMKKVNAYFATVK